MKNRPVQALLALFAIACACTSANPDSDAGSTSTRSETTGWSDSTDTGDPVNPWCCWCDEGEIRCVDETGPGECKAFGAKLGVDVVETECTGLPVLGTLDCPGLVCDGGTTETGAPPLDIPVADLEPCCACPDPIDTPCKPEGAAVVCKVECIEVPAGQCPNEVPTIGCEYVGGLYLCDAICG